MRHSTLTREKSRLIKQLAHEKDPARRTMLLHKLDAIKDQIKREPEQRRELQERQAVTNG